MAEDPGVVHTEIAQRSRPRGIADQDPDVLHDGVARADRGTIFDPPPSCGPARFRRGLPSDECDARARVDPEYVTVLPVERTLYQNDVEPGFEGHDVGALFPSGGSGRRRCRLVAGMRNCSRQTL